MSFAVANLARRGVSRSFAPRFAQRAGVSAFVSPELRATPRRHGVVAYSTKPEATTEFDPEAVTAMDKQAPPSPGRDFRVAIVGAGNINFGSDEGPWNHSFRLEQLKVTALIDPSEKRAKQVLKTKCESFVESAYKDTKIFPNAEAYIASLKPGDRPHAIWVGSPPAFRGRTEKNRDLEVVLCRELPDVPLFVEKPVSTGPVDQAFEVVKIIKDSKTLVSVGYMLRYLKVVQKMKQILEDNNLNVMSINARYIMAYEHTAKLDWWDKTQNCGPIIEQATHFCDLARYFGGEADLSSVMAHSVEYDEPAGQLSKIPVDESLIEPANRIPRVTCATWKFEKGAVGSLTHCVALQGHNYSTELDVYADGHMLRLVDPYNSPILYFRRPGDDHEEIVRYQSDDPFFSEVSNFIDCIEDGPNAAPILSSYEDAAKTYALTWAIRMASERTANAKKNSAN
ncbi:hypothetical protein MYAM1_001668 [Malassezia yamatoensis]|uniref:NAD binding dehydrogenase n=1 Tax=Malassezia yamatoensis TaxID=253288 RepID=A0AAJ6CH46_9BASI|nr:hypothetical protein MYAM1_001668 [Malassezia yamatoensis]